MSPSSHHQPQTVSSARSPESSARTATEHQPTELTAGLWQCAKLDPARLNRSDLLQLQRTIGNQAVAGLLASQDMSRNTRVRGQRTGGSEEEIDPAAGLGGGAVSSPLQRQIQRARGGGHTLPGHISAQMGQAFGQRFDNVKVHTDGEADTISRSLNANALTIGSDIFFRKDHYRPATIQGKKLLAHELTHVVQQSGASDLAVQTKLTVGAADTQAEREADQVAAQVVQRQPAKLTQSSHLTTSKSAVPAPIRIRHKARPGAVIARALRDRAAAFEQSLGVYAFHHPKAKAAAQRMSDHVRKYIEAKAKEDGATEKKIDALWQKAGHTSSGIAGAVGDKIEDIKAVFASGNVRERMTHIYNFMDHHFGNVSSDDPSELFKIAKNSKELNKQFEYLAAITGDQGTLYYGDVLHKSAGWTSALMQQNQIRERTSQDATSTRTVKDVGLQETGGMLSEREARFMLGKQNNKESLDSKQLTWSEGAKVWKMRKTHEWVQAMERLDMPLMAGPSAHTNAFMNIAQLFGMKDLASVRLAVIGHLLPIHSHSLVEIMTAGAGHGLFFTPGPEMYRSIAPLSTKELRRHVGKGSFPDEFGSATTGSGGDYAKLLKDFRAVFILLGLPPEESNPQKLVKKLSDLDKAALAHINKKDKEKNKLKNKPDEFKRLDERIKAVEKLRQEIKPKLAQARSAVKLNYSRKRIQELQSGDNYKDRLFHGTHTGLLAGLAKSKGTLISGKELEDRGIVRSSGEGDFFSSGENKGPKEFISVGLGEMGMGTALAYAQAAGTLSNYNIERYKDDELQEEVRRLQEAIDNFDISLLAGMRKTEREYKTKAQLQNLYDRLNAEVKLRADLPKDHPRRRGELGEDSNFPLLFEFDSTNLDVRDDAGQALNEQALMQEGIYKEMLGERMVYGGTIDLKPLIRAVYCPVDKIDEVTAKLSTIMGHSNFEVLAIEALYELPATTPTGGTRSETYAMQVEFEDVRKDVISGYAQGMKTKQKIDNVRQLAKEYGALPPQNNKESGSVTKEPVKEAPKVKRPPPKSPQPESSKQEQTVPQTTSLEAALAQDGLKLHKIKGNGNCLFAAVLHQLAQLGVEYKSPIALRLALSDYIQSTSTEYQQSILAPIFAVEKMDVQQAATRISTPGYWNSLLGDTAPQLLANLLERPLILYRPDGSKQTLQPYGASKHTSLHLVYNGHDHYDSVTARGQTGPMVSEISDIGGGGSQSKTGVTAPSTKVVETGPPKTEQQHGPLVEHLPTKQGPQQLSDTTGTGQKEENKESPQQDIAHDAPKQGGIPGVRAPNLLSDSMLPVAKPQKGKPHIVLSGHGLLKENTKPAKTKVPGKMSISFTGPVGSILDNPLANAVEENRLRPEEIFIEAVNMETGIVTEIEPHEILKLYKLFGPRTVKGGKLTPNYTLTPPGHLAVTANEHVFTVSQRMTLQEIFALLRRIYPKGVHVSWAACQDLPGIDRMFQIKVMNIADRFVSDENVRRPTTEGKDRSTEIKLIKQMIKDFGTML